MGYANDVVVVIKSAQEDILEIRANEAIRKIDQFLEKLRLEIAPQKSEAIIFTRKHKIRDITIEHKGQKIELKQSVKYLGITLDRKLSFTEHLRNACQKAATTANNINKILPRTHGADEHKRKLLAKISKQIVLYGAPVWDRVLQLKTAVNELEKTQRINAIRVSRAYRTIYTQALLIIGRLIPWEIKLKLRQEIRNGETQVTNFEEECLERWQDRWQGDDSGKGERARSLIPEITPWYHRSHGELTYELTQYISGHGTFNKYLHRIGKKSSANCNLCDQDETDDPDHSITRCAYFSSERTTLEEALGLQLENTNLINEMLETEQKWQRIQKYIEFVISTKETLDRLTEAETTQLQTDRPNN